MTLDFKVHSDHAAFQLPPKYWVKNFPRPYGDGYHFARSLRQVSPQEGDARVEIHVIG